MRGLKITEQITKRDSKSLNLFFEEINKYPILTEKTQKELLEKSKKGDSKASEILFNSNLRFVVSVAKQYHFEGFQLVDLIQEGSLGLLIAIKKGEVRENSTFLSYAVWWIRSKILEYIAKNQGVVLIPLNKILGTSKIKKANSKFFAEFGRDPTLKEILEITKENPENYFEKSEVFLSKPLNDDSGSATFLDIIPSKEEISTKELDEKIISKKILSSLPSRKKNILKMYFGIDYDRSYTLEEISREYEITRERARQLKEKALFELKIKFKNKQNEEW